MCEMLLIYQHFVLFFPLLRTLDVGLCNKSAYNYATRLLDCSISWEGLHKSVITMHITHANTGGIQMRSSRKMGRYVKMKVDEIEGHQLGNRKLTTVIRSDTFVISSLQLVKDGRHIVLDRTKSTKQSFMYSYTNNIKYRIVQISIWIH